MQQITKGAGVVVGVIDTGVDGTHPDMVGQVLPGSGYGTGVGGDGHTDPIGHGTGMASVIVGKGGGANHMLGIAPASKILPLSDGGIQEFPDSEFARGPAWLAGAPAPCRFARAAALRPAATIRRRVPAYAAATRRPPPTRVSAAISPAERAPVARAPGPLWRNAGCSQRVHEWNTWMARGEPVLAIAGL